MPRPSTPVRDAIHTNRLRTFIAVDLPEPLRIRLGQEIGRLSPLLEGGLVRWMNPKGIHLTLKFLGDVDPGGIEGLAEALRSVASGRAAFRANAVGVGCFPSTRRPRVLWVGVQEPSGALSALQGSLEAALSPLGYPREDREYNPHLTLGRVRREARPDEAAKVGAVVSKETQTLLGEIPVGEIILFRSELKPSGAVYTPLAAAVLEARD